MACEPETDLENAGQFSSIIPPGMHAAVQSYLLAKIRGGSMDVNEIMQEAKCYSHCIPPGLMPRIKTWLLCQLSNTGGETPIPVVECVPDEHAQAFITAAGLTDETQISAICQLVQDLKTYPAVGTKYWNRETLIYPFVGGSAASHAVNLKTPGTYDLLYVGAGLIHSVFGVQGDGASCANTQYTANVQNSFRAMWYLNKDSIAAVTYYFGQTNCWSRKGVIGSFVFRVHDATSSTTAISITMGAKFIQRYEDATKKGGYTNQPWESFLVGSAAPLTPRIALFALNNNAPPGVVGSNFSTALISSFSFGTPLDITGGQVERDEYKGIWDRFHTRLGRGHP